jgi:hypothetical protein
MGKFPPFVENLRRWMLGGIRLQFFAAALSLPILIAWGLPISIMSIAGNLLATPFLIATLLLSSLLFLTELAHLPNGVLYTITNWIIDIWHWLLGFSSESWLIGFNAPPFTISIVLCAAVALGLWVLVNRYKLGLELAACITMASCIGLCFVFKHRINDDLEQIYCVTRQGQNRVIDSGFFARKTSYKSPARYRIKPQLYKVFGSSIVHQWHCSYAGTRSLRALVVLLDHIVIKQISFGALPKKQVPSWIAAWHELEAKCAQKETRIVVSGKPTPPAHPAVDNAAPLEKTAQASCAPQ